jgi:hypothetical protein
LYNRLADERGGTSSYIIGLSNGGPTYIIGNIIEQGPKNRNRTPLSCAAEGEKNLLRGFYINTGAYKYTELK